MNRPLKRLLWAQGGKCFFCEKRLPETEASVEHLVASSNGGSNGDQNCVACCKALNALLGNRSLKEKIQVVLNQKGRFACPDPVATKVAKKAPLTSPKALPSLAEHYAQVVENLKQRGSAKPRTVAKLKSTIAALLQSKLSSNGVDALIQQLQSCGVISISGTRVTYPAP